LIARTDVDRFSASAVMDVPLPLVDTSMVEPAVGTLFSK